MSRGLLTRICYIMHAAGDIQGFTDTYLEGLGLQCQMQRTVSRDTVEIFEQALPYEMYLKLFGYLSEKDLCTAMTVCKVMYIRVCTLLSPLPHFLSTLKAWYTMCMDGELWHNLYKKKWSRGIKLEAQFDSAANMKVSHRMSDEKLYSIFGFKFSQLIVDPVPFTKDWYGKYKQRVLSDLNTCKKVACVDLGSFLCKFAVVDRDNSTITTSTIESVVAVVCC